MRVRQLLRFELRAGNQRLRSSSWLGALRCFNRGRGMLRERAYGNRDGGFDPEIFGVVMVLGLGFGLRKLCEHKDCT